MECKDFSFSSSGASQILCCQCGVPIVSNPANMCIACFRSHVDITEDIPKQAVLQFCRNCERYLQPPNQWISCALESRQLLSLCLQKLKGLNKVKLIDAGFVWTEPHSKRIKVKLSVQGEIMNATYLQQVFIVEYMVTNQMCSDCHRSEAQNFWRAVVQLRQKAENKKTMLYAEQLILKHKAHEQTLSIKPIHGGLDFFFATEANARKLVDFFNAVLPCRNQTSKRLMSRDIHSNTCNYKFTYSVEIVPISKDSVVCLSKKAAHQLGSINQLCLVSRVTNSVHLIDPTTGQIAEINSTSYWRDPFEAICDPKQLITYVVMSTDPILNTDKPTFPGQGALSKKHIMADVWVIRESDLGLTEDAIHTRSHLGHILNPGDAVLGYSLRDSNINDKNFDKLNPDIVPDVILVKKYYVNRRKRRNWKLKHITGEPLDLDNSHRDYDEFLNDLEEDPEYRKHVNIYRHIETVSVTTDEEHDADAPQISLEEMLSDLHIDDKTDSMETN